MAGARAANGVAETARRPILLPEGFSAGTGYDIVSRSRLTGLVRRHRDGSAFAPRSRSVVAVVPKGGGTRAELLAAFRDPASSGLPVFEIVPPRSSRILSAASWCALAFSSLYVVVGLTLDMAAPYALRLSSLEYGLSGKQASQVKEAASDAGEVFGFRDSDPSHAERPFHVKLREFKEGAVQ